MNSINRFSKLGIFAALALSVLVLSLMGTRPASADPTLFIGNILQSGGILNTTVPVTTLPGPQGANYSSATNTPGGGFTIPAAAFSYSNPGYTFALLPDYPYVFLRKVQRNEAGSFAPGYFSPGVATTKLVDSVSTMVFPFAPLTPHAATVKLVPGSAGFGGSMQVRKDQTYIFQIQGPVFLYSAVAGGTLKSSIYDTAPFGSGLPTPASIYGTKKVAHMLDDPGRCCTTRVAGEPSASASGFGESHIGPWATGMLYVNDAIGADTTATTQTGVDNRTAFDSGVISLVSPRIQHVFDADGTGTNTIIKHREEFSVVEKLELQFIPAPEPGVVALVAGGVLGLAGLARIRRRR